MKLWLLLIPYILLLVVNGIQLYLAYITDCVPQTEKDSASLQRYRESSYPWYFWLVREGKDWLAVGIVGGIGAVLLSEVIWSVPLWLGCFMVVALLFQTCLALLLLLATAGHKSPLWLQGWALSAALPDTMVGSRWRAGCWGGLFLLVGIAGLWTWLDIGGTEPMLIAFITLLFGFLSMIKAFVPDSQGKEEPLGLIK